MFSIIYDSYFHVDFAENVPEQAYKVTQIEDEQNKLERFQEVADIESHFNLGMVLVGAVLEQGVLLQLPIQMPCKETMNGFH